MTISKLRKNAGLIQAFRQYRKRYLSVGKKPAITSFIPEIIYRTMKLEGEIITRKQVRSLFK